MFQQDETHNEVLGLLLYPVFGTSSNQQYRIIWEDNGIAKTPSNGFECIQEANELDLLFDMQPQVVVDFKVFEAQEQELTPSVTDQVQRGIYPETITDESMIVLHRNLGWCVRQDVPDGFQLGPLRK